MKRTILFAIGLVAASTVAMAGTTAPSDVSFDDQGAVTNSLSGAAGDPESGKAVMTTRGLGNCIACHEVSELSDFPFHGEIGPPLDGVAGRWSAEELRGIVANAKMTFPDTMMPAFYKTDGFIRPGNGFTGKAAEGELEPLLSAQQIEDVVAYLLTLNEE